MSTSTLLLSASMFPNWAFVAPTRRFVADLLERSCRDEDHVSRVALTVHELVENAVKYGRGDVEVKVSVDMKGFAASIEVTNRTTVERRAEVASRLASLKSAPDRQAHYLRLLGEAAKKKSGGLGLARIMAEATMNLSSRENGDALVVVAEPA